MKTIDDLQTELSLLYGKLITNMTPSELTTIMAFLLTTFADDFPIVKSVVYKYDLLDTTNNTYKEYLLNIDEDFLEIKYMIPVKPNMNEVYTVLNRGEFGFMALEELYAIQLAADYIADMGNVSTPKKPMILSDSTGEFVTINKDCIIMALCERVIDPANISEHVYSVLRAYATFKFIDFILNRTFGNTLDMNSKIFDLMYNNIASDMTSEGGAEGIASVSLGGLSVSFDNKLQGYAQTLGNLAAQTTNPTFIQEMNKLRAIAYKAFKRKKNVFYNYVF